MREIRTGKSSHERGAVLIVALIMLLLLTLIGVAGIRDSQLQEKMAGGTEDRAIAFQAAESALREGELMVVGGTCTGACATNGYYGGAVALLPRVKTPSTTIPASEADFWGKWFGGQNAAGQAAGWADTTTKVKAYAGTALPDVATQPRYVIELLPGNYSALPQTTNSGANIATPCVSTIRDYLITARGTGRTDQAVVILQSLYRYSSPATQPCP